MKYTPAGNYPTLSDFVACFVADVPFIIDFTTDGLMICESLTKEKSPKPGMGSDTKHCLREIKEGGISYPKRCGSVSLGTSLL